MKDKEPLTQEDIQEMEDWVKNSYKEKFSECIELFLKIRYPDIRELTVERTDGSVNVRYIDERYSYADVYTAIRDFIEEPKTAPIRILTKY